MSGGSAVLQAATVRFNPRAAAVLGAGYTGVGNVHRKYNFWASQMSVWTAEFAHDTIILSKVGCWKYLCTFWRPFYALFTWQTQVYFIQNDTLFSDISGKSRRKKRLFSPLLKKSVQIIAYFLFKLGGFFHTSRRYGQICFQLWLCTWRSDYNRTIILQKEFDHVGFWETVNAKRIVQYL